MRTNTFSFIFILLTVGQLQAQEVTPSSGTAVGDPSWTFRHVSKKKEVKVQLDQKVKIYYRKYVNDNDYLIKHKGVVKDITDSLMRIQKEDLTLLEIPLGHVHKIKVYTGFEWLKFLLGLTLIILCAVSSLSILALGLSNPGISWWLATLIGIAWWVALIGGIRLLSGASKTTILRPFDGDWTIIHHILP